MWSISHTDGEHGGGGIRSGVDAWYALSELVDKSWKSYSYMEAMQRP